jgi:hypothetical protein
VAKTVSSSKIIIMVIAGMDKRRRLPSPAVGAAFVNKKRSVPIGYFHDEAVYGVEMVEDEEPLIVEVPVADVPLPDSRTSFPVSKSD